MNNEKNIFVLKDQDENLNDRERCFEVRVHVRRIRKKGEKQVRGAWVRNRSMEPLVAETISKSDLEVFYRG